MSDFDLQRIVYEIKFNSKWEIAKNVISELEKLGIPFSDFLSGLGTYMDASLQLPKSAGLVQRAHEIYLSETKI